MSTADFRHIAFGGDQRNRERLFRAAISAFCTLTRPTRNELAQLDDLALGLFDSVSAEGRRFAAAALCECDPAPMGLVRRLSHEPVNICAPLLVRSRAFSDVDLIALIGRHGVPHARAIARRDNLHPVIGALIRALVARAESEAETVKEPLEAIRDHLRELMREDVPEEEEILPAPAVDRRESYTTLREAALSSDGGAFVAALSRVLEISPERARRIVTAITYSDLITCLRAVGLSLEQAFLVTAAVFPAQVTHMAAIRLFLERYMAIDDAAARDKVDGWRSKDLGNAGRATGEVQSAAIAR